jgi:hypothetical protein
MTSHQTADAASYRAMTAPRGQRNARQAENIAARTADLIAETPREIPRLNLKGN